MILSNKSDTQQTGCLRPPNSAKGSCSYCIKFPAGWLRNIGFAAVLVAFMLVWRNICLFYDTLRREMVTPIGFVSQGVVARATIGLILRKPQTGLRLISFSL